MVNATINNQAISITLGHGESTTVPSGEVWKVTITSGGRFETNNRASRRMNLTIENVLAYSIKGNTTEAVETVLTGGDTLDVWSEESKSQNGVHISGFVVN